MTDLATLERRVAAKWLTAAAERAPQWDVPEDLSFDWREWITDPPALPPDWPQFPREQWLVYPHKRQITLLICERALDQDLSEDEWMHICLLMMYGGKERIA